MVEKISKRLDCWKSALLEGWFVNPFFLSLVMVFVSVANRIEMRFRNFLWNDFAEHHRYHLVEWNWVCCLLREGGLEIRRIRNHNRALLGKWLWRFEVESDSL